MSVVFKKSNVMTDVPFHYCPGCTHGVAHRIVAECIEEMGLKGACGRRCAGRMRCFRI